MSKRELKAARDEASKYKAERDAECKEFECMSAMYKEKEAEALAAQKGHEEALARIAELEKIVDEQQTQNKTLELLSLDLGDDCKWLLTRGVPLLADRLVRSKELAKYMFELGGATYNNGCKDGYAKGKAAAKEGARDDKFELSKEDCVATYATKRHEFEFIEFGILKAIDKLAERGVAVETLKKVLGDGDAETSGAGSSQYFLFVIFGLHAVD
ncbi:hypothetical protein HanPI659440_Chr03g0098431 [Helianthus annuus]|nr:hypothetical protein HanPI659440_Chr03g0098431 [Helianthus annuus]